MVFFFQTHDTNSDIGDTAYTIYMGRDKFENEDLIAFAWPGEDVWFHVDKLSSAHVYLRLHRGQTIHDIPESVLTDCAQLVKQNSIQGCKENNIRIVYTPVENLKKTGDMAIGQVGFHDDQKVKTVLVRKKENAIINRLEKTRREAYPDLKKEREDHERSLIEERKARERDRRIKEEEEAKERERIRETRSYDSMMTEEMMRTNTEAKAQYASYKEAEEDFL